MLPVGAQRQYGSKVNVNWSIPALKELTFMNGVTADGVRVWAFEKFLDTSQGDYFSLYDAGTRTRLFSKPQNQIATFGNGLVFGTGSGGAQPFNSFGAIGANQYIFRQPLAPVVFVDSGGNTTQVNLGGLKETPNASFPTLRETVVSVAPLDWPKGTMVRQVIESGKQFNEFIVGDIVQTPTEFTLTNRQVIRRVEIQTPTTVVRPSGITAGPTAQFLGFDRFNGHWGAVILYTDNIPGGVPVPRTHYEVFVDGTSILHYIDESFPQPITNTVAIHTCHAHESLGAGYVAFANLPTATDYRPRFVMAKAAGIQWQRDLRSVDLHGSTDRWVYFRITENKTVSEMTGGQFSRVPDYPQVGVTPAQYYIVRHDNSEIVPVGRLTDTHGQIEAAVNVVGGGVYTYVRDSQAVSDSIPASYEEMWNQRNG